MAKVERHIELKQLKGRNMRGELVGQAVDEIYLNGIRIGYKGHKPDDPINFIRPGVLTDEPTLVAIRDAVAAKFGGGVLPVNAVPELVSEEGLDQAIDTSDERAAA